MKDKIVKILENGTEGNYLLTSGNIERIATQIAKLYQLAVSEDKLSEIFANHADNTPYLNFTAFKEAVKELLNQKR